MVYIAISGLIGAGKTTLAEHLSNHFNIPIYYEPVKDNVYLEDFYKNPAQYSFAMQVFLFNKRYSQQREILKSGNGIQDRTLYEDNVFAKCLLDSNLMTQRDYDTYMELFEQMTQNLPTPDVIIHLDVNPEESLRRIQMRHRDCESSISLDYLVQLNIVYQDWIQKISKSIPVIVIDYNQFADTNIIIQKIKTICGI